MDRDLGGCLADTKRSCRTLVVSGFVFAAQKWLEGLKLMLLALGGELVTKSVQDLTEQRQCPLFFIETLRSQLVGRFD